MTDKVYQTSKYIIAEKNDEILALRRQVDDLETECAVHATCTRAKAEQLAAMTKERDDIKYAFDDLCKALRLKAEQGRSTKTLEAALAIERDQVKQARLERDKWEQELTAMTLERDELRQHHTDKQEMCIECEQELAAMTAERDAMKDDLTIAYMAGHAKGARELAAAQADNARLRELIQQALDGEWPGYLWVTHNKLSNVIATQPDHAALDARLKSVIPNLESRDFYEVMQAYRTCPVDAYLPFEAVKAWLRNPTHEWDVT
jgi:hypothetical protein